MSEWVNPVQAEGGFYTHMFSYSHFRNDVRVESSRKHAQLDSRGITWATPKESLRISLDGDTRRG